MNIAFPERKWVFPKSVHFGRILENAKRPQKISFSIRVHRLNAARGPASFSAILEIAQPSLLPSASDSLTTLQPSKLSPRGSLSGSSVCYHSWNWTRREHSVADSQWSDSAASGPMPPIWKWSCGLTTWSWRSNICVCPGRSETGTSPPCAENSGGSRRTGSNMALAMSCGFLQSIPARSCL